jgi:hypothetical protein
VATASEDPALAGAASDAAPRDRNERPPSRLLTLAFFGLVLAGGLLRITYFAADTALWGDEAAVALNLQARTYTELLRPLDFNQHAPAGFLLLEKVILEWCGWNERCLRLPALAAALLSLPAFWALLRTLTASTSTRLLALGMVSLSPALVRYAGELKPYSLDVLASLLVCHATVRSLKGDVSWRLATLWTCIAVVLVWFSFPVAIVMAGCGVALALTLVQAGNASRLLRIGVPLAAAAGSFLVQHRLIVRHSLENSELVNFWSHAFIPFPPTSLWDLRHSATIVGRIFQDPLGLADVAIPAALALLGALELQRERRGTGLALGLTVMAAAALSAAQVWPFSARLVLFLIPVLATLVAAGAAKAVSPFPRWLAIPAMALALSGPQFAGVRDALAAPERSGIRSVLEKMAAEVQDGDTVYVYYKSRTTFDLYRPRVLPRRNVNVIYGERIDGDVSRIDAAVSGLRGHERVWVVFSEVNRWAVDEYALFKSKLDARGRTVVAHRAAGAVAMLYVPAQPQLGNLN